MPFSSPKEYKITYLTRHIEFGISNRSISNKEPSGIRAIAATRQRALVAIQQELLIK
jgi:hypothetical protein